MWRNMAGKLAVSIAISALLSFLAWILLQLNHFLGVLLFISAVIIPPAVFRDYYSKRPLRLAPFLIISLVLMVILTPPPVTGPNVEFGLHFATGCWKPEENPWPLNGSADVAYSCYYLTESGVIHVSGMAWEKTWVRLPITGRVVVLDVPTEEADSAYLAAVERAEKSGYEPVAGNQTPRATLLRKGRRCVYIAERDVLGEGVAVVSARGNCEAVEEFARIRSG
ncbi:hypothetical protein E3E38_06185 [Thermococcus sp. 18S1]|uniref:hypothetical protein n=1 Tax=Thermococcus sp. 18S1 TaxID=1638210 RepID=UPI00143AB694|nr:hypothetical protein [Thermococcus sp. 18S1]NJE30634.1 hypothetical protein [Thermococcus sp. 18S1]